MLAVEIGIILGGLWVEVTSWCRLPSLFTLCARSKPCSYHWRPSPSVCSASVSSWLQVGCSCLPAGGHTPAESHLCGEVASVVGVSKWKAWAGAQLLEVWGKQGGCLYASSRPHFPGIRSCPLLPPLPLLATHTNPTHQICSCSHHQQPVGCTPWARRAPGSLGCLSPSSHSSFASETPHTPGLVFLLPLQLFLLLFFLKGKRTFFKILFILIYLYLVAPGLSCGSSAA